MPEINEHKKDGTIVPNYKTEAVGEVDYDDEDDLLIDLDMISSEGN